MSETYIWDGMKATRINDLPASAWVWYTPHLKTETEDTEKYYKAVPWLYRGTQLRCDAVAGLPFAIVTPDGAEVDSSEDYQNVLEFLPNPDGLLWLIEASLTLLGRAYVHRLYNQVKTLQLRYLMPTTIEPVIDGKGLHGFNRAVGAGIKHLTPEEVLHFWLPDPFVELGPPRDDKCPGMAALQAAGVLYNLNAFAAAFFERGAIKATLLKVGAPAPANEVKRLESWWKRVFQGIGNAWSTKVVNAEVETETIGEGIGELSDSNLTKEQREDIATSLGIPMTILWSTEASGLGGGGVVSSDERKFYEQTIVPEAKFIARILNEQLLVPMGYRLAFRPETLDVFQADENERAQALSLYVNSGFRLSVAAELLGIELPEGMDYDDLDEMREEDRERAAERMAQQGGPFGGSQGDQREAERKAMMGELRAWRTKAKKVGGPVSWNPEFIPAPLAESLHEQIRAVGVDDAFAFLKKKGRSR